VRIVRLFILSLVILTLVVSILSFLIPSHIRISRTVRIDTGKEVAMQALSDPAKWKEWYPGADTLPFFYDAGIIKGLILRNEPKLSLVISGVNENEVVTSIDRGHGKEKIISTWRVIPEIQINHITVQWYMDFHLKWYPWEKISSLMYDKLYGFQMEQGLANLKNCLESK
jgi:hypothetical protein